MRPSSVGQSISPTAKNGRSVYRRASFGQSPGAHLSPRPVPPLLPPQPTIQLLISIALTNYEKGSQVDWWQGAP